MFPSIKTLTPLALLMLLSATATNAQNATVPAGNGTAPGNTTIISPTATSSPIVPTGGATHIGSSIALMGMVGAVAAFAL